ncbi:MAG: AAA family ATPase [Candidatus Njordarchaeia archaeon]
MKFFDREKEIETLKRIYNASLGGKFNFVIISGRRGVGKTRLVYEFSKYVGSNFVYLFVEKKEIGALLNDFVYRLEGALNEKLVYPKDFGSFLRLI